MSNIINNSSKYIFLNEKLSKFSWFNLGGKAEIFLKPDNEDQLEKFLKGNNKLITILGAGSNTIIRDGGIKGVTIKLSPRFSYVNLIDKNIIEVGAGTLDKKFSNFATENSLSGFEFLSCIPGSIGGGIKMNCGCYGFTISDNLISIMTIDYKGNKKKIDKEQINFFYRGCNLDENLIILSAKFKGKIDDKKRIIAKQEELLKAKKKSQPKQVKTCGSTFKNPNNIKAWKLIKDSGCENMSVGNAKVSEKHCNFFINDGNTTSQEVEELITKVKNKVFEKTGTNLELEIKIIGINS
mgnify:CR=1 FL=1|tara:strand:+ start:570 stop:1457 length:888 start_codon:yes stop_codon:yes gene_type:complete